MKDTPHDTYRSYREALRDLRMPLAFVDLDAFDRNVAYVAATQQETGKTIRVHSKSIRCVDLMRRIFDTGGEVYQGIMTINVTETAFLAERGFDDFIVGYPTAQPEELKQLVDLEKSGKKVSLMVDCIEHLDIMERWGRDSDIVLHACLDLDMAYRPLGKRFHLGVRRSPLRTTEQALAVAKASRRFNHVEIDAVMGYEAHIAGPNDDIPGKSVNNAVTRLLKKLSMRELTRRRGHIVEELLAKGLRITVVNGGGSGSLKSSGRDPSLTEVTAGSAFYCPALFWHYRDVTFLPAAFFAIQVVRTPATGMITCQGGGYIASGAAGPDKLPRPVYPDGLKMLPMEGAGEVQTPFVLPPDAPALQLGDPVILQHAKGGELCERFNDIHLIREGKVVDSVKTYRGDGLAAI